MDDFNGLKLRYIQLVAILFFCYHLLVSAVSKTAIINILPSVSDSCPAKPCLTLDEFSRSANDYTNNYTNITLIFQPGNHSLHTYFSLGQIHTLVMSQTDSSPAIICEKASNFNFKNIDMIHITGIHFNGCGSNKIANVQYLLVSDSSFYGTKENTGTALWLTDVVIANITRTNFVSNNGSTYLYPGLFSTGGAIFASQCGITISECIFERNNATEGGAILIHKFRHHPQSIVNVTGSTFNYNSASTGGALAVDNGDTLAPGVVCVSESFFDGNVADEQGGALFSGDANVTLILMYPPATLAAMQHL